MIDNVRRGAEMLDEKYPGWYKYINEVDLDMYSLCDCIVGQLRNKYHDCYLGFNSDYGFDLPYYSYGKPDTNKWFSELKRLWQKEVRNRMNQLLPATAV